jgi:predicted DNA-binding transcriptional regulator AlpA
MEAHMAHICVILVTLPEAARLLWIGKTKLHKLIRTDPSFPPVIKIGRCSRLELAALQEWIRQKSDEHRDLRCGTLGVRLRQH